MSHTALANGVLLGLLAVMILLLVMCLTAVILTPPQAAGSGAAHSRHDSVPPPLPSRQPSASVLAAPLPRRQSPVTAPATGFKGWPAAEEETTGLGAPLPLMHDGIPHEEASGTPPWELIHDLIPRPEVSGKPPWEPAPKPSGLDG